MEKHHIIYKSQGGLDFDLNYKYLSDEEHRGNNSPHKNRSIDLQYKEQLEQDLRLVLPDLHYEEDEVIEILSLKVKQASKAFRHLARTNKGMCKEELIKRLLGGRYYI